MGFPDHEAEKALLKGEDRRDMLSGIEPALEPAEMVEIQRHVTNVHASDHLIEYVQAILTFTRDAPYFQNGLSPRAGLALLRAAQSWALMDGRDHVLPEDVQALLPHVIHHRLEPNAEFRDTSREELHDHVMRVAIP